MWNSTPAAILVIAAIKLLNNIEKFQTLEKFN
jgi:hypothetical protein